MLFGGLSFTLPTDKHCANNFYDCIERFPAWKSNSRLGIQDNFLSLWEQNFRFCIHSCPLSVPILKQTKPICTLNFFVHISFLTWLLYARGTCISFFFKNLVTISMFKATEGWSNGSCVVVTKYYGMTCETQCFLSRLVHVFWLTF